VTKFDYAAIAKTANHHLSPYACKVSSIAKYAKISERQVMGIDPVTMDEAKAVAEYVHAKRLDDIITADGKSDVRHCPFCDKECHGGQGLAAHKRHCKDNPANGAPAVNPVVPVPSPPIVVPEDAGDMSPERERELFVAKDVTGNVVAVAQSDIDDEANSTPTLECEVEPCEENIAATWCGSTEAHWATCADRLDDTQHEEKSTEPCDKRTEYPEAPEQVATGGICMNFTSGAVKFPSDDVAKQAAETLRENFAKAAEQIGYSQPKAIQVRMTRAWLMGAWTRNLFAAPARFARDFADGWKAAR